MFGAVNDSSVRESVEESDTLSSLEGSLHWLDNCGHVEGADSVSVGS